MKVRDKWYTELVHTRDLNWDRRNEMNRRNSELRDARNAMGSPERRRHRVWRFGMA